MIKTRAKMVSRVSALRGATLPVIGLALALGLITGCAGPAGDTDFGDYAAVERDFSELQRSNIAQKVTGAAEVKLPELLGPDLLGQTLLPLPASRDEAGKFLAQHIIPVADSGDIQGHLGPVGIIAGKEFQHLPAVPTRRQNEPWQLLCGSLLPSGAVWAEGRASAEYQWSGDWEIIAFDGKESWVVDNAQNYTAEPVPGLRAGQNLIVSGDYVYWVAALPDTPGTLAKDALAWDQVLLRRPFAKPATAKPQSAKQNKSEVVARAVEQAVSDGGGGLAYAQRTATGYTFFRVREAGPPTAVGRLERPKNWLLHALGADSESLYLAGELVESGQAGLARRISGGTTIVPRADTTWREFYAINTAAQALTKISGFPGPFQPGRITVGRPGIALEYQQPDNPQIVLGGTFTATTAILDRRTETVALAPVLSRLSFAGDSAFWLEAEAPSQAGSNAKWARYRLKTAVLP